MEAYTELRFADFKLLKFSACGRCTAVVLDQDEHDAYHESVDLLLGDHAMVITPKEGDIVLLSFPSTKITPDLATHIKQMFQNIFPKVHWVVFEGEAHAEIIEDVPTKGSKL